MDKSNRYFSESIGRGRDEYETFFSQEKLLPGGKGPSENPADIGPGELFSGDDGTDQGGYYKSDFEIYADRYGSYGNRDTGKGRNKSPSLIANIPIIDLQKTAKMP